MTDIDTSTEVEVTHPSWCTGSEPDTEAIHLSSLLYCDPDGTGMAVVALRTMQAWPWPPRPDLPPVIELHVTDEGETRIHFLPLSQVRELIENAQLLLGQIDTEAGGAQ